MAGKRERTDVRQFNRALMHELMLLHHDLRNGLYVHGPYERFTINDPKPRTIHKASVRDRVLHRAIYRQLYPLFDLTFIHDSYSCRNDKGTHRAVGQLVRSARQVSHNATQPCWALKLDIRRFFDSIDHEVLLSLLRRRVHDHRLAQLLEQIIRSFTVQPGKGLPLGNLTSQLFANVYLDPLDKFVKHQLRAPHYLRYADDFVLLGQDKRALIDQLVEIQSFLIGRLQLLLHPGKVSIRKLTQGIDFLGYVVLPHHTVLRTRTKRRMLRRVTEQNLPSYLGLLEHCSGFALGQFVAALVNERTDPPRIDAFFP